MNHESSKTIEFNKTLIAIHYFVLVLFLIFILIFSRSEINISILIFFCYSLLIGYSLIQQVWEFRYDLDGIDFILTLGRIKHMQWEEIRSLTIQSAGREIYTIRSPKTKVTIDGGHGPDASIEMCDLIIERARLRSNPEANFKREYKK